MQRYLWEVYNALNFQFDGESNFNLWGTEMIKSKLSTGMAYVYVSNK